MTHAELYQRAFAHESWANHSMLKMLAGVPQERRSDPRFARAVNIAAHMCRARNQFIDCFTGRNIELGNPFVTDADLASLEAQFTEMETAWKRYLAGLDEPTLEGSFVFADGGQKWRMSLDAQMFQLAGHAAYHRGQVVLLVDQLGGETFDTDYIEWFTVVFPEGWSAVE